MFSFYPYGVLMLISAAILCVLFFAYGVARYMAKPVWMLMDNITNLSKGVYEQKSINKGIYKDVFVRLKQLSTNLQELNKKRNQLDKMREEWITNLTHDLKTPLSSIKGYSELLADKNYYFTAEERIKYAKIIESKSLYIEKLIDDLKLTYQVKNDILPLNKKDADIIKVLRELIISYVNNPAYQDKKIEFIANSASFILKIDEKLIQRALNNIIVNAIVHNSSGTHIKIDRFWNTLLDTINRPSKKSSRDVLEYCPFLAVLLLTPLHPNLVSLNEFLVYALKAFQFVLLSISSLLH